jgi:hypothetical protein
VFRVMLSDMQTKYVTSCQGCLDHVVAHFYEIGMVMLMMGSCFGLM